METVPFECPPGTVNTCWQCAERIAWDIERGNWAPLPGSTLLVNFIGGDPKRPEYLDRNCNYVRRDGSIIRTAEQQFGVACVDGNAICPPARVIVHPCPSPSPSPAPTPSPGPTPSPSPTGPCPAIAGLGGQVAQFQWQHQTVPYHREGEGGQVYVANGPADRVNFDTTVYYGCAAPRCDSEHDPSLARCEDLHGQRWRVLSGNVRNCEPTNPGEDGRGFGYACDAGPGEGAVEACTVQPWISTETGEHVPGSACRVIRWRID